MFENIYYADTLLSDCYIINNTSYYWILLLNVMVGQCVTICMYFKHYWSVKQQSTASYVKSSLYVLQAKSYSENELHYSSLKFRKV